MFWVHIGILDGKLVNGRPPLEVQISSKSGESGQCFVICHGKKLF